VNEIEREMADRVLFGVISTGITAFEECAQ